MSLPALTWQNKLVKLSRAHVQDIGAKDIGGHKSSDGENLETRMRQFKIITGGTCGESIDYGKKGALDVILSLAIDDSSKTRSHRKNMFNDEFTQMACYTGDHMRYRTMTCINYNGSGAVL